MSKLARAKVTGQPGATTTLNRGWREVLSHYWVLFALALLMVTSSLLSDAFLTPSNMFNVLRQVSINGLLAIGLTFVVLSGGIDLSTGAVVQGVGMIYALAKGLPLGVAVSFALLSGAVLGLINGTLANRFRIDPFLVTLGTWVFLDGFSLWVGNGMQIIVQGPSPLKFFGQGYVFGVIPVPVLLFVVAALLAHVVLTQTVFGRILYAIGGNEQAAHLSGIRVSLYRTAAYVVSGTMGALAGIVMVGRLGLADPTVGYGLALDAVAAVVIGGTRLGGGRGRVWGTVVGAILLGVLSNLFNLNNVSSYVQLMTKGVIIIGAVSLARRKGG
jgi:ribose transport system permease protein